MKRFSTNFEGFRRYTFDEKNKVAVCRRPPEIPAKAGYNTTTGRIREKT